MEDYQANRKGKQPGAGGLFGTNPQPQQSTGFNFGGISNTTTRKYTVTVHRTSCIVKVVKMYDLLL